MKINLLDTYCVEYSISQKYFHIETLGDALKANMQNAITQGCADYQIVGIRRSHEECKKFIVEFQKKHNIPQKHIL